MSSKISSEIQEAIEQPNKESAGEHSASLSSLNNHGGDMRALEERSTLSGPILDFSANINPLGPPENIRAWISRAVDAIHHYPEPDSHTLRHQLSDFWDVSPQHIQVGNGASELIQMLSASIGKRILTVEPAFSSYRRSALVSKKEHIPIFCKNTGISVDFDILREVARPGDLIYLGHPNNPDGKTLDISTTKDFCISNPDITVVIDESFIDFMPELKSFIPLSLPNVIVIRSFTKFFAIPGLRLGYAVFGDSVALDKLLFLPEWSVNSIAQSVGSHLLEENDYTRKTINLIRENKMKQIHALNEISGVQVVGGAANFLLCRLNVDGPMSSNGGRTGHSTIDSSLKLERVLLEEFGIAIRSCDNFLGLGKNHFRIAIRGKDENAKLIDALINVLRPLKSVDKDGENSLRPSSKRTPALMFQGTGSNAGKSLLTAAFCRILLRKGFKVAPFKSQNMSLNSFVTHEGLEISRAQALQAAACRISPEIRMNPVLLKPNADTGTHILLNGKPVGHMRAADYQSYKQTLFAEVKKSYDSLSSDFDAIVLEGAGSPGEVNLKKNDIVNMNMARYARSPVLLVGDIDRGGVFASFIGTMEVLTPEERQIVAGFIVNKFRGDASLLNDAFDYTFNFTGKHVLGVVPFIRDLGLPEEDSMTFKLNAKALIPNADSDYLGGPIPSEELEKGLVRVTVIDLPHISNFTDLDALYIEEDLQITIVRSAKDLPRETDIVIIPGSRNTIYDLDYLRQTGIADWICSIALRGKGNTEIVGICGGLQMIGNSIIDKNQIESNRGRVDGLSLIDVETEFLEEKTLRQVTATHILSGLQIKGYEVHHGQTKIGSSAQPAFDTAGIASDTVDSAGNMLGFSHPEGRVWGTYMHGIFDDDVFRRWWIDQARAKKGLNPIGKVNAVYNLDAGIDRLANEVSANTNVDRILEIMGL